MGWGGVGYFSQYVVYLNGNYNLQIYVGNLTGPKRQNPNSPGYARGGMQGFDLRIKRIKFEKLSDPDIAFPETLHEKP